MDRTAADEFPADTVLASPRSWRAGALVGDVREVSLVMADLRGFTAFCERAPLVRMSRVLNQYLAAMVDVILERRGRVQDFVGDGVLGVFGAPDPDPDHAWHAALSAMEMHAAMGQLSTRWARQGTPRLALGVAVHSGLVFAGTVGSPRRMKYAVVGDPVNTVARLEELNRTLGTQTVMSGETVARLEDRVSALPLGTFSVRGRHHPVDVFQLLGVQGTAAGFPSRASAGGCMGPGPVPGESSSIATAPVDTRALESVV